MDAFHAQNLVPEVFCLCDDARGATLWVKEGLATAIFPQSMEPLCEGLACQVLDEPDLVTKILLIWQKEREAVGTCAGIYGGLSEIGSFVYLRYRFL